MTRIFASRASQLCRKCSLQSRVHQLSILPAEASRVHHLSTAAATSSPRRSITTTSQTRTFSYSRPLRSDSNNTSQQSQTNTPTAPKTHYDIFPKTLPLGPPPAGHFPINLRTLRTEFLSLQSLHHPDLHPPGAPKLRAEALSALINEAYKTLSNPLLRAQYLLSLRGVDVANDETLKIEEPDLLMLVLEAREEIEDAEEESELEEPRRVNEERIRGSEEVLERAFREDDVEGAKREAVRLRYWVNIKESLDAWEKGKPVVLQH